METLEGRQSVFAALQARRRRMQVILIAHGSHLDKLEEMLTLANELGVPVKHVDRAELDAMAHGSSHGGVLAIGSALPRLNADQLLDLLSSINQKPLLLLLEGGRRCPQSWLHLAQCRGFGGACGAD